MLSSAELHSNDDGTGKLPGVNVCALTTQTRVVLIVIVVAIGEYW